MKQFLLIVSAVFLLNTIAFGQAPVLTYPGTHYVAANIPFSVAPSNTGGAVPATNYGQVTTIAGTAGTTGNTDAAGAAAAFDFPEAITADAAGNLYVADYNNKEIRKIVSGVVTTYAGSNGSGFPAAFQGPNGVAMDVAGNLYVSDYDSGKIFKITPAGVVTTVVSGINGPAGISLDNDGNIIVAAQNENSILKIDPANGNITPIAGNRVTGGYVDAAGNAARFTNPTDVKVDAAGNLFVADYQNNLIRKIISGTVSTIAGSSATTAGYANGTGTAALFKNPTTIALANGGMIYVTDFENNNIRAVTPGGVVSLLAGSDQLSTGSADGLGPQALFKQPSAICVDGNAIGYITDGGNNTIRKIILTGYSINKPLPAGLAFNTANGAISGTVAAGFSDTYTVTGYNKDGYSSANVTVTSIAAPVIAYSPSTYNLTLNTAITTPITPSNTGGAVPATNYGQVTTIAGTAGTTGNTDAAGAAAAFDFPEAITADAAGNLYVADYNNKEIRKIVSGVVTTYAGSNGSGFPAAFQGPNGVAMDVAGNLYVSDYDSGKIFKITPAGVVTTVVSGINGPAGISLDNDGNIIVAAQNENSILKIDPANGNITPIAGNRVTGGYVDAAGNAARFTNPTDVKVDAAGNLFVADYQNNLIRKIISGTVSTIAGSSATTAGYANGTGTAALFKNPTTIALANGGMIYVTDFENNNIRAVTPGGVVSLLAGSDQLSTGSADGLGPQALFKQPSAICVDGNAIGYITDGGNNTIRKIILTGYSINKPLPAGLAFNTANGAISGTPNEIFSATDYIVTAYNIAGYAADTVTLSCGTGNNWTGLSSTDWGAGANWDLGHVPTATETAQIGVVAYGTNQPDYTGTNSTAVKSVIFGSNGAPVLTIEPNQTLVITDGLTVNLSSVATINGPGTINISGTSLINNTASLTASSNAIISLGSSSTLTNSGTFTLASDVTSSATITEIPSTSSVIGPVSVQRYLNGNALKYRGYRLLSSPVHAATIDGNNVYSINYLLNTTFITGTNPAGGFSKTGNPSLYLYREDLIPDNSTFITGNYRAINNLTTSPNYMFDIDGGPFNIPVGSGYLFFFRGDLTTVNPYTTTTIPNPATLTATGTLNQGSIAVKNWLTPTLSTLSYTPTSPVGIAGSNLVGNPYPSSIDWDTFQQITPTTGIYGTTDVSNTIYELDPITKNYGAYIAGSGGAGSAAFISNVIVSGQGFFIVATGQNAQLTFNESAKTNSQNIMPKLLMGKPVGIIANNQYLRLQMEQDSMINDQTLIRFNSQAPLNYTPNMDALYKSGYGAVSLSTKSSDLVDLSINTIPLPKLQAENIKLNVNAANNGNYIIKLRDISAVPQLFDLWLLDTYKKDSVNLRLNETYSFDVDKANSTSFGSNRFVLEIKQNPNYAYRLLDFNASKLPSVTQVQVAWKTLYEENYTNFTVERSTDGGKNFDVLIGVSADGAGSYGFVDKSPVNGQNFYRLKQEDINNTVTYSKVVGIFYSDLSNNTLSKGLSVYPNPARSTINLAIAAPLSETATYNIKVINSSGLVVQNITSSQSTWQGNISNLLPGSYIVRVFNNKDQTLVGRTKFEKL